MIDLIKKSIVWSFESIWIKLLISALVSLFVKTDLIFPSISTVWIIFAIFFLTAEVYGVDALQKWFSTPVAAAYVAQAIPLVIVNFFARELFFVLAILSYYFPNSIPMDPTIFLGSFCVLLTFEILFSKYYSWFLFVLVFIFPVLTVYKIWADNPVWWQCLLMVIFNISFFMSVRVFLWIKKLRLSNSDLPTETRL